ncbi:ABC transporter ATP-binding protein/permease [Mumia sp. zg.B53]|uniref:ABC transporter ATP-binding protein n=1 Tax=unclassified Mumia TaxID=2621872 RepID=UPI001C6E479A|nr:MULTISPECIES: ABC transporter ATP-binding protein [unclassified Mumia]MBW9205541.1 ABC transporter ATP-binding protein/permease [Mumia sp. zg.B17]MBW9216415.1 ABC transporter ATP-binding protein/permease [Mumia sp. zg.B53]MDD9347758.1 ABC transporter ATP-binding protein [Mumia sp.]
MLWTLARTYLRPYRGAIALVLLFQLVSTLANLYLPGLNADIIDKGIVNGDTGYILRLGGIMLLVTCVQVVCSIVAVYFGARTAMAFGRDLRESVFRKVESFAAQEVSRFGAPTLITRSTNDVQQIQMVTFMVFVMLVAAPIMCVGGIVMALRQDLGLSWLIAVVIPLLVVAVGIIIVKMRPYFQQMQGKIDVINRILREQIMGIQVIRAFVKGGYERERFAVANAEYRDVAIRAGQWMALMFPTVMLVMNASSVAVLWFGGHRVADGTLEVGTLTAYLTYLVQILMAVMMATFMFVMLPRAEVSADRVQEVLSTDPTVVSAPDADASPVVTGQVELAGVGFSYPEAEEPVLCDVDLVARPGETTAIIGSTGSGKSTLLNLIPRLFDVTDGRVLLDGVDVRDRVLPRVWEAMGLVPQRAFLFSGTVATNLRMGSPEATDEQLWEALEIAQADDFVRAMPEGLNAPIAQGGTNVSGGQRQRLAIARAVVSRPLVYLFDDSFSALDFATDAALRRALRTVTADAAVIVVAQRVSTIRDADRIVVLDQGRVVGTGTHADLMDTCETYREIVLSQLTAQEAA